MRLLSLAVPLLVLPSCGQHETLSRNRSEEHVRLCIETGGSEESCRQKYGSANAQETVVGEHTAELTLYTTENTAMEGGSRDRCGRRLGTLEAFLAGNADFVSVAMDTKAFPYDTVLRIPEVEKRLNGGQPIEFRVVDTGQAFVGKGKGRIDVCAGNSQSDVYGAQMGWMSKAKLHYQVVRLGQGKLGACPP